MEIYFHAEDVKLPDLPEEKIVNWLNQVASLEGQELDEINVVFCSDEHLLQMNRDFLNHDYYTDIITFDYTEEHVAGDIFISLDRVVENAQDFSEGYDRELRRVIVHGVLHLLGYKDKTDDDARQMRAKEEAALSLL